MAYQAPPVLLVKDRVIRIGPPYLPTVPRTALSASSLATATSITVLDNAGFVNGELFLAGKYGEETAEIKKVNGAVTAGTALTTTALTYNHPVGTPISKVFFDAVEISGAATLAGSKTVITTPSIDPSSRWMDYVPSTEYAFYFVRYKNTVDTYYSAYSDGVASTGYAYNSVGFIANQAFGNMREEITPDGPFTPDWVYDKVYAAEMELAKPFKKAPWLKLFEQDAGNISAGTDFVALPSDIANNVTAEAIYAARIGADNPLAYVTKAKYDEWSRGAARTTVASAITASDTSITLTSVRDMTSTGTVLIGTDTIAYTSKNNSTGVLSGCTGVSNNHSVGDRAFQGATVGVPARYTVYGGNLYFDAVPDSSVDGQNLWLDYYSKVTRVDSMNDTVGVPDPYAVVKFLEMEIKRVKANGRLPVDDISVAEWLAAKKDMVAKAMTGTNVYLVPDVPSN